MSYYEEERNNERATNSEWPKVEAGEAEEEEAELRQHAIANHA